MLLLVCNIQDQLVLRRLPQGQCERPILVVQLIGDDVCLVLPGDAHILGQPLLVLLGCNRLIFDWEGSHIRIAPLESSRELSERIRRLQLDPEVLLVAAVGAALNPDHVAVC